MARLAMPRMRPLRRKDWVSASVIGVAVVAYFVMLAVLDTRAAAYFRTTRATDPDLYLDQLRSSHGFDAYLPEYAALKGFEDFAPQIPDFLMGRWTMRLSPIRLMPGERADECTDPITFGYGVVVVADSGLGRNPARYRIADGKIEVEMMVGSSFDVTPVSFGSLIDYLTFTPPGRDAPVYAYLCAG